MMDKDVFHKDAPASLGKHSREAMWYEVIDKGNGKKVHCLLCPHGCLLEEDDRGVCRTRVVKNGKLHTVAYGNACSACVDPIEKKPLNHFLPGTSIFSISTGGCNLRCPNCQNWQISQARPEDVAAYDLLPEKVVEYAIMQGIPSIAYTYTDPVAYYEYAYDTARLAHEKGIRNVLVTAGYVNPAPIRAIARYIDAAHIDVKGFTDSFYKDVPRVRLAPVLKAIETMKAQGIWVELIHLVIPTMSDDIKEIYRMAKWMVESLGPGTPLHLSRFYPSHKLLGIPPTSVQVLNDARAACLDAGLRFVYVGNVPGSPYQNTDCPKCGKVLIERQGYFIASNQIGTGTCSCGETIPGIWY